MIPEELFGKIIKYQFTGSVRWYQAGCQHWIPHTVVLEIQRSLFVDAGNIWTIRDYKDQPGGQFEFDKFYKQIAVAYGLGLRLDLDFFVLRFDGGMKAVNPAYEKKKRPLSHYPS